RVRSRRSISQTFSHTIDSAQSPLLNLPGERAVGWVEWGWNARSRLDKSLRPPSIGLWISAAYHVLATRHRVDDRGLEFVAIHPPEAPEGVKRKERDGAGWAAEKSLWIACVAVVTHNPEQKIFGQGFIFGRHLEKRGAVYL